MPSPKTTRFARYHMDRWIEAKQAVRSAAYFEYLLDYKPGWVVLTDYPRSFVSAPTESDLIEFRNAGADYLVFYKPELFPSQFDREKGLGRYRAWAEKFLHGGKKFPSDAAFNDWLIGWEAAAKKSVNLCHSHGIRVLMQCSNAFNVGGHVYNENWFGGADNWVTTPVVFPEILPTDVEVDLMAPKGATSLYFLYCQAVVAELVAKFHVDGIYYDDNSPDLSLLRATADAVHRSHGVLMLHHSSDDMISEQFNAADYWYVGEHHHKDPYEYLRRPLTNGCGFMYGVSLSNQNWNEVSGPPENTVEEVGFGFLMCAIKFPALYPASPKAKAMWKRYLPLYKRMVKPSSMAYVGVTDCSLVHAIPGQYKPLAEKPPLFYSLFVNDRIHMVFTNNGTDEALIQFTRPFKDLQNRKIVTEAKLAPQKVLLVSQA